MAPGPALRDWPWALSTECARPQAGVKPVHHRVNVVDRQAQLTAQCRRIRRHVGAYENDGTDLGSARYQRAPGVDDVMLGQGDVQIVFLGLDQHAEELAPALRAGDRRI